MLTATNISFSYSDVPILKNISFKIPQGQNVAIIGESGCGKSTLLKLIYGIYDLNEGQLICDENLILGPKYKLIPGEDYIKYLAQDFDLMPFITVAENVGKFLSNIYKDKKASRVQELLELVGMTAYATTKAKFLSGGQQQRVALARVLALEPKIILLDEPFSQIDSFQKNTLRRNLFAHFKQNNITCIIATHDATDALSFSEVTMVMQNGSIIAQDSPQNLYNNPNNLYVAALFGEVNQLQTTWFDKNTSHNESVLVYPHQLRMQENVGMKVIVKASYYKGAHYLIAATYNNTSIFFEHPISLATGEVVFLGRKF